MKKLFINKKNCQGCGACVGFAPNTFALGKDGKSRVISNKGDPKKAVAAAISCCPGEAISYIESIG